MALLDGIKLRLSGRDFIVPPLTLKQLRLLRGKMKLLMEIVDIPTEEQVDAILEITHAAISRNYPEITLDEIGDLMDLGTLSTVFPALMSSSGMMQGTAAGGVGPQT